MAALYAAIIDQSSSICENELMLDVLNYTSSSNCSSVIEKLLKDENNLEYNIKNLIKENSEMFSKILLNASFCILGDYENYINFKNIICRKFL